MITVYDHRFNLNEWLVISTLIIGIILVWKLKKRFPRKEALVYLLYSIFIGMVFDHTISLKPFDLYDVNDNSSYQLLDFFTYVMYGPYGYLYIYVYDYFKIKLSHTPFYILMGALFSCTMELLCLWAGIFHYKNGYKIYYSFPIYLIVLSFNIYLYRIINQHKIVNKEESCG